MFTFLPAALAAVSVSPTVAISGSVKMAAGIAVTSIIAPLCPAMTSAATSPSLDALWAR